MTIIRYNPWSEMNSLQRQLNKMFDDSLIPAALNDLGNLAKFPAAELTETEHNLMLKLEVPGMQLTDFEIEATVKTISISGDRQAETKSEETGSTRSEFRYGSFQRVITLPARIQNTKVKAEYKNGILYLTLPKAEAEKNKVVKVNLLDEVTAE